jgi:di/tripeptidase
MASNIESLQPHSVWAYFAAICAIPHTSHQEAALREMAFNPDNPLGFKPPLIPILIHR